ncbi:MAG TPA: cytochrome c, partial [Myxococcaceae bacterium]|nr:cytochrome c [Myxococcaceae bacterium]
CHGKGRVRPELTVGLYEPDYLVQRIRWLPGRDSRQMPPMYLDRLVDSDLRNIVTYLAGEQSERIFKRKRKGST